jgi:hypothetical protein
MWDENDKRLTFLERRFTMPFGDGTGPAGMGPMTGRAAGFCAGYPVPGYMNPVGGRGYWGWGRGFRGGGFGRGRGFGWGRAGYGLAAYGGAVSPYSYGGAPFAPGLTAPPAYGAAVNPYAYGGAPFAPGLTAQQELDGLKGQAEYFEDALDGIKKRIEELESQKSSKE